MQDMFYTEGVDLEVAGRPWIGQRPITLVGDDRNPISSVRIAENFGRFGNNFYQIINALVVASRLECRTLFLPPKGPEVQMRSDTFGALRLQDNQAVLPGSTSLEGGFYAPFGFERMFTRLAPSDWAGMVDYLAEAVYANLALVPSRTSALAIHLRGGDIFTPGPTAHPWYVQPPGAYYVMALRHALLQNTYDTIMIITEDEANPARRNIINFLESQSLPYSLSSRDMISDIKVLCKASCIIASSSTFCEVSALLSPNLKRYYSFRRHNSQDVFKPFAQSRVDQILTAKGVKSFLTDDITFSYTGERDWTASEEQIRAIVEFPEHNLRLFPSNFCK